MFERENCETSLNTRMLEMWCGYELGGLLIYS